MIYIAANVTPPQHLVTSKRYEVRGEA